MELKELIDLSNKAFQEKDFKKVIDLLKKVIVLQPNRYEIYLRLGLASSSLGNFKDETSSNFHASNIINTICRILKTPCITGDNSNIDIV